MALIFGQLESAQFENKTSDYSATVAGRVWYRTDTAVAKIANGSAVRQFLINDGNIVIGNNATANNNVRLHRGANAVLQFVLGGDTTAEGTLSTSLGQLSFKHENYSTGSRPSAGVAGRIIFNTTRNLPQVDNGTNYKDILQGSNPEIEDAIVFTEQGSTPSNPSSGFVKMYCKNDGKFYRLTSAGLERGVGGGPSLGTDSIIRTNAQTISEDITFAGTENGSTVGPVTIASTYTVTVTSGSTWVII